MADTINVAIKTTAHTEAVRLSQMTPKQKLQDYVTEAVDEKNQREKKRREKK